MSEQKHILITGGLGYIGSHAVVAFEQAGYRTIIIDNLVNSSKNVLLGIEKILGYCPEFYECDIRDRAGLEMIFGKYDFLGVIHFAGLKAFGESTTYPYMYFDNNVGGSLILFDVMDRYGVKNIVFSSSASVYDGSNNPPFTENMILGTTNPYATSKLNVEYLLKDYSRQKGFRSAVLRYFNLVGAHQSGYLGDYPRSNHGSLSSNIFDVIFGKRSKLFVYGNDFPTPDGTAIRDYIDVCDLIDGHICALKWCIKQEDGKWDVWNLGTGKGYSVNELIAETEQVTGMSIPTEVIPRRNIDLAIPISNPQKAQDEFSWKAKRGLKESIENTYKFLLNVRKKEDSGIKRKVMHFVPYFPPHSGGVEMYAYEWAINYQNTLGHACIVTFSVGQKEGTRTKGGLKIIVLPAFDIVHSFPFPMFWLPSFWRGLYEAKKWNPDIVHTHTRFFLSSLLGGIFAKVFKKIWIHIEHGSGFVVSSNLLIERVSKLYDYTVGRWTLLHADEVVAVSEACEHFVRVFSGVKNIRTIYRGIVPIEPKIRLDDHSIRIGYIGRLVDLKGVDILLHAFSKVKSMYEGSTPISLTIVGDGPEKKNLEELVKSLGCQDSVHFLGRRDVEEVRTELLPSFHIFVNPSFQEGLPTTVIEALIAGCNVIATDVGGTREILRYAAFTLVAPRSTSALAEAIMTTMHDKSLFGKRISPSLFLWEQTFREFREIYNQYL